MKTLLRSTIIDTQSDDPVLFLRNYLMLLESGLGFEIPEDTAVWSFIQDFVTTHHHAPSHKTIRAHFERVRDANVVDRIEAVVSIPPLTQGDFQRHLEQKAEDRRTRATSEILTEAARILSNGVEIVDSRGKDRRKLFGPVDAIRYVMDHGHDIVTPTTGAKLSGDVTHDADNFQTEYDRIKADPLAGIGQHTGIQQIDEGTNGAKRHELWIHAAFTGHLKSTLMLNWAYNQAVYHLHDVMIFSLEMPYNQCRRLIYALHSCNAKFDAVRAVMGIGESLDYIKVRDGLLSPQEERFMFEHVAPDMSDPANKYGSIFIEVADPDKVDFTIVDLRARAELVYSKTPFSLLFIDHLGLMASRNRHPSTTEKLNEVIRDTKKMAMSFNRGMGMAVVGLFQISREGFKAAEKNGGRFNLTHLSYANEAERSSDVVTAGWLDDDLRKRAQARFQCLKSRDQRPFETFNAGVVWACRRLKTIVDPAFATSQETGTLEGLIP